MPPDLQILLPLYALDVLDASEAQAVEEWIAGDPAARAELAALRAEAHDLVLALPSTPAPPHVLDRLLAATGAGPFDRFADRFAAMFDLAVDRGRELLGWFHDPSKWHPATPGVRLMHFRGGPAHAGADCGVIKMAVGAPFPWHGHTGEEHTLFLGGKARDHEGREYVAGDELVLAAGSAHEFSSVGDEELTYAVRYRGVDFAAKKP